MRFSKPQEFRVPGHGVENRLMINGQHVVECECHFMTVSTDAQSAQELHLEHVAGVLMTQNRQLHVSGHTLKAIEGSATRDFRWICTCGARKFAATRNDAIRGQTTHALGQINGEAWIDPPNNDPWDAYDSRRIVDPPVRPAPVMKRKPSWMKTRQSEGE